MSETPEPMAGSTLQPSPRSAEGGYRRDVRADASLSAQGTGETAPAGPPPLTWPAVGPDAESLAPTGDTVTPASAADTEPPDEAVRPVDAAPSAGAKSARTEAEAERLRRAKARLVFDDPLYGRGRDDSDRGWGDRPSPSGASAADLARFLDEKPPHHI
jgi:hypothetical protein